MSSRDALLIAFASLFAATAAAQEGDPPVEPVDAVETAAQAEAEDQAVETEDVSDEAEDRDAVDGDAAAGDAAVPEMSPEEQAKIERAKQKREERKQKRNAKKAKEQAKQEAAETKRDLEREGQLIKMLDRGYRALEEGELKNATQAFQNYIDEATEAPFEGEMGLAHTRLAAQEPAAATRHAIKAAKSTTEGFEKAAALVLAGEASLAARPRDEATGEPLPATEMYQITALRFYLRAIAADPGGAEDALGHLDEVYPTETDEQSERLLNLYLEQAPRADAFHSKRLAASYEALISGEAKGETVAVGGIQPPIKKTGERPPYPQPEAKNPRRRLLVGMGVTADGTVSRARVFNGTDPRLDRLAVGTLNQWTFEPARLPNGTAVPIFHLVTVKAIIDGPLPSYMLDPPDDAETDEEEAESEEEGDDPDDGVEDDEPGAETSGDEVETDDEASDAPMDDEEVSPALDPSDGDEPAPDEPPAERHQ